MYYKYPRTPHLPWSPGRTKDDRVLTDVSHLEGKHLIATVKMDGECFSASTKEVIPNKLWKPTWMVQE